MSQTSQAINKHKNREFYLEQHDATEARIRLRETNAERQAPAQPLDLREHQRIEHVLTKNKKAKNKRASDEVSRARTLAYRARRRTPLASVAGKLTKADLVEFPSQKTVYAVLSNGRALLVRNLLGLNLKKAA